MPIYTYNHCGNEWESVHSVGDRHREKCPDCSQKAKLVISSTARPVVLEYYDNGLGERVTGPAHRRRLMKEKNLADK